MMQPFFCCPHCGEILTIEEKRLLCPNGHSFDRAAQGYVHLLLPQQMHAKIPGDNKEMVAARRLFLDTGSYALFREGMISMISREFSGKLAPILLDAGCGEGYYTDGIARALAQEHPGAQVYGFDISKLAVRAAAIRSRSIPYAVASCFSIPAADRSVDGLLAVFSPIVPEEFARVIKPGGFLLLAVAGPRHLFGLKEILYDSPYENERRDTAYPGFSFCERLPLAGKITLTHPEEIEALFSMTPYYWKTPAAGAARLRQAASLTTEIAFDLLLYRRTEEVSE